MRRSAIGLGIQAACVAVQGLGVVAARCLVGVVRLLIREARVVTLVVGWGRKVTRLATWWEELWAVIDGGADGGRQGTVLADRGQLAVGTDGGRRETAVAGRGREGAITLGGETRSVAPHTDKAALLTGG